ncbi:VOC family protein [Isoptericola cucumis]|uniref:Glyoxalase n=1 Tax=Isoptericola cucumis TaxID=1776856 RepID=A0ABQ2B9L1_9MICO|nr:VOC family protein [Isoptericola cucumis]GGI11019.1 glyoxalase [Isoptericola cucumis]
MNEQTRHTETSLALDVVTLAGDLPASKEFYASAFSPLISESAETVDVDMHGTGRFELAPPTTTGAGSEGESSPFPGYVVTYALAQPAEVQAVMDAAAHAGAHVLKPAKKALFGSFSGAFRAPDGSIWKVAADSNKKSGEAAAVPRPTEISIILGVKDPRASRTFYQALGMATDRDYGNKYIDFQPQQGAARLCLMPRAVLAKDVGIDDPGHRTGGLALGHRTETQEGLDQLMSAAESAGGSPVAPQEPAAGSDSSHFTDPDGFRWSLSL